MMEENIRLLVAIEILGHNSVKETHQDDVLIIFDSVFRMFLGKSCLVHVVCRATGKNIDGFDKPSGFANIPSGYVKIAIENDHL